MPPLKELTDKHLTIVKSPSTRRNLAAAEVAGNSAVVLAEDTAAMVNVEMAVEVTVEEEA
ncbi:hypothetical protein BVRB_002620 [Beta vulgaris subsp. vulgaris]|uniref:Uncharacterized protein n=1 Tax=Beta vulgaris subsp. vulgaris TaxID=3555 RepID=A0A0J8B8E0_BETVV|nr:hypothetical protein BVRB_002620 [Beta vulgaris subsp. vulgaris]